jgi:hypothetical protein
VAQRDKQKKGNRNSIMYSKMWMLGLIMIGGIIAKAQVAGVKISFAKDTFLIGDYIQMHLSATYKDGDVLLPIYKDSFSGFEIIESNPPFIKESNGLKEKCQDITLIQFNAGQYNFSPAPFIYKNNNKLDTLYSNSFSVFVNTIALDTTDIIKPVKGPIQIPYTWRELMPYLVGVFMFLIILGLALYWYTKRRKKKNPMQKMITKQEAHEIALQRLRQLDAAKKWQAGDVKNYYLDLSEIIRDYIENRFLVLAKESTTQEIISSLTQIDDINQGQIKHLKELLQLADLAKFAKMVPLPDENTKAMKLSFDFVAHTKPKKENSEENNKETN